MAALSKLVLSINHAAQVSSRGTVARSARTLPVGGCTSLHQNHRATHGGLMDLVLNLEGLEVRNPES